MNTHNVKVKTAATETWVDGTKVNTGLTADQFQDLSEFIIDNGTFCGPGGVTWQELALFKEITTRQKTVSHAKFMSGRAGHTPFMNSTWATRQSITRRPEN
ncbi:hypothetical protein KYI92_12220 [Pantoea allii]|nr:MULTISPECIES: hypothetical protein [Pantoea]MBW1214616.1 hypothetical protein [Pantoea allii]MBW1267024.1 hypothetical protein [Pantoea allii]MBW1289139.1 hypothetical protein [Pantoea allii]OAE03972.1 hypothetical protein A6A26_23395 [Pantoea sp. OXWO6B1]